MNIINLFHFLNWLFYKIAFQMQTYTSKFRVYYEDTDAGGVVYHTNYLKFAERARTEILRMLGINQQDLIDKENIYFVVHSLDIKFENPAKLDDEIVVYTKFTQHGKAFFTANQVLYCKNDIKTTEINVKVVCTTIKNGKFTPCKIPDKIAGALFLE